VQAYARLRTQQRASPGWRTILVAVTLTVVALGLFALERDHQLAAGAAPDVALARAAAADPPRSST
jgi:ABC-type sulfate/molybdate transport systems ATPase subunit